MKFKRVRTSQPDQLVLDALARRGSDFSLPHPVRLYLYFPDEARAHDAAAALRKKGYATQVSLGGDGASWRVRAERTFLLSLQAAAALRAEITALAASYGGDYDGWEAAVTKAETTVN